MKLLNRLVELGYPEDRLSVDIASLIGLYAFWDQDVPPGESQGKGNPMPKELYQFPWGNLAKAGAPTPPGYGMTSTAPDRAAPAIPAALTLMAVDLVKRLVGEGNATRHAISLEVFKTYEGSERDQLMELVFSPELTKVLEGEGIHLEGETFVSAHGA